MAEAEPSLDALRSAVQLACQPQNARLIVAGRQQVLAMPRGWVLTHIEQAAAAVLDLTDYWDYRRLLELTELLDPALLQRFVTRGIGSDDPDLREAAEDHRAKLA